jgi:hypothetical protein
MLSIGTPVVGAEEAVDPWGEPVAEGIEYREYTLPGPVNVFVTRMDRNNPQVTIESSIAQGRLSGGTETVSGMAQRYDGAINYWDQTWGNTNKVAVAINGYYFNFGSGIPYQGQVHSGWYSKLFDPCESGTGGSGFAWNLSRDVFIGESVRNPVTEIVYPRSGDDPVQIFDGINKKRGSDQFILYTPQYGRDTGTDRADSIEVLVRMSSPSLINPNVNEMPTGVIEDIRKNKGSTLIPFDHVVLSFQGSRKTEFENLNPQPQVGEMIGIRQKIRGCLGAPDFPWENTYASIGGAFYFLKDGVVNGFLDNDNYIFFIVVDGRDDLFSKGMTIKELGEFARDELGATHGIAEDGGGSSTMVVNGEVKNNTFCNIVFCKSVVLPFVTKSGADSQLGAIDPQEGNLPSAPKISLSQPEQLSADGLPLTEEYYTYAPDATGDILQRLVANGMMMVVVQPKDQLPEPRFAEDDPVKTSLSVNVRLGPGTNYGMIATVSQDTTGRILGNDNGLNGVWAKSYRWWRVLLDGPGSSDTAGWVIDSALVPRDNMR